MVDHDSDGAHPCAARAWVAQDEPNEVAECEYRDDSDANHWEQHKQRVHIAQLTLGWIFDAQNPVDAKRGTREWRKAVAGDAGRAAAGRRRFVIRPVS